MANFMRYLLVKFKSPLFWFGMIIMSFGFINYYIIASPSIGPYLIKPVLIVALSAPFIVWIYGYHKISIGYLLMTSFGYGSVCIGTAIIMFFICAILVFSASFISNAIGYEFQMHNRSLFLLYSHYISICVLLLISNFFMIKENELIWHLYFKNRENNQNDELVRDIISGNAEDLTRKYEINKVYNIGIKYTIQGKNSKKSIINDLAGPPLLFAILLDKMDIVKHLVEKGAEIDFPLKTSGHGPDDLISLAWFMGHTEINTYFIEMEEIQKKEILDAIEALISSTPDSKLGAKTAKFIDKYGEESINEIVSYTKYHLSYIGAEKIPFQEVYLKDVSPQNEQIMQKRIKVAKIISLIGNDEAQKALLWLASKDPYYEISFYTDKHDFEERQIHTFPVREAAMKAYEKLP